MLLRVSERHISGVCCLSVSLEPKYHVVESNSIDLVFHALLPYF